MGAAAKTGIDCWPIRNAILHGTLPRLDLLACHNYLLAGGPLPHIRPGTARKRASALGAVPGHSRFRPGRFVLAAERLFWRSRIAVAPW